MDRGLHIEVSGYRISVSRRSPEPVPSAPGSRVHRSQESSTSSFQLVDRSPASQAYLTSSSSSEPPYPLQAPGPSGSASDVPPDRQLPARPQVRSLFSPPSPGSPSQVVRPGRAQAERRVEAAEPLVAEVPAVQPSPFTVRSVLSSPLRVPEYPLPGPLRLRG